MDTIWLQQLANFFPRKKIESIFQGSQKFCGNFALIFVSFQIFALAEQNTFLQYLFDCF